MRRPKPGTIFFNACCVQNMLFEGILKFGINRTKRIRVSKGVVIRAEYKTVFSNREQISKVFHSPGC